MFLNHGGGSAIDKRFIFQFAIDCSQFRFDLGDFFIESLALCRFVSRRNR